MNTGKQNEKGKKGTKGKKGKKGKKGQKNNRDTSQTPRWQPKDHSQQPKQFKKATPGTKTAELYGITSGQKKGLLACHHFQFNKCQLGDACEFVHEHLPEDRKAKLNPNKPPSRSATPATRRSQSKGGGNSQQRSASGSNQPRIRPWQDKQGYYVPAFCPEYRRTGYCTYEDRTGAPCKYSWPKQHMNWEKFKEVWKSMNQGCEYPYGDA